MSQEAKHFILSFFGSLLAMLAFAYIAQRMNIGTTSQAPKPSAVPGHEAAPAASNGFFS